MTQPPCRPRLDRCRSKGSSIGGVAPREQEGPQRIGVRKSFIVVPAELWSTNSQSAKPLGRWLVDNRPRGANLDAPDRREPARLIPFIDEQ